MKNKFFSLFEEQRSKLFCLLQNFFDKNCYNGKRYKGEEEWSFFDSSRGISMEFTKATSRSVLWKNKVFLEILQNSQENTSARASFLIKLLASGLHLFYRTPRDDCFWIQCSKIINQTHFMITFLGTYTKNT